MTQFKFLPRFDKDFSVTLGRFVIDFEVHAKGYRSFTIEQQPDDQPGAHKQVYKVTYYYNTELRAIQLNTHPSSNFEVSRADRIEHLFRTSLKESGIGFSKQGRHYTDPVPQMSKLVCQHLYFQLCSILSRMEFESAEPYMRQKVE